MVAGTDGEVKGYLDQIIQKIFFIEKYRNCITV